MGPAYRPGGLREDNAYAKASFNPEEIELDVDKALETKNSFVRIVKNLERQTSIFINMQDQRKGESDSQ